MNTCPVYRQTGGHAYGSVYPGPIGAILTPQLMQMKHAQSLPYASSLCGACYEVCPVKINIPEVLIDLRAQVTDQERHELGRFFDPMYLGLRIANLSFRKGLALSRGAMFRPHRPVASSPARTDGFTRCPAWARKWTQTRDLRGLPQPDLPRVVGSAAKGGQMTVPQNRGNRFSTVFAPPRKLWPKPRANCGSLCRTAAHLYPPRRNSTRRSPHRSDDRAPARIRCRSGRMCSSRSYPPPSPPSSRQAASASLSRRPELCPHGWLVRGDLRLEESRPSGSRHGLNR